MGTEEENESILMLPSGGKTKSAGGIALFGAAPQGTKLKGARLLPKPPSALGATIATTDCTFCEGEDRGIPNLELVVAGTGGNTCGSIKQMAAREVNGSDVCTTIQKEERTCCPPPWPAPAATDQDAVPNTNTRSQSAVQQQESKHLQHLTDEKGIDTMCQFCEDKEGGIFNRDLIVPQTRKRCDSIMSIAAGEVNGSDVCKEIQQQEKLCCPDTVVISAQGRNKAQAIKDEIMRHLQSEEKILSHLFIHIPKSGGEDMIVNSNIHKHAYTMVRNPTHHVLSQYFHCKEGSFKGKSTFMNITLDEWLNYHVDRIPRKRKRQSLRTSKVATKDFNCYDPIDLQSRYVGFHSMDTKETELKERFDVIGVLDEIGRSICATIILYTGEVPAICICSTGANVAEKRRRLDFQDHGVKHHGATFDLTDKQQAKIAQLTVLDTVLYQRAKKVFDDQLLLFFDLLQLLSLSTGWSSASDSAFACYGVMMGQFSMGIPYTRYRSRRLLSRACLVTPKANQYLQNNENRP
eukprot:scaffold2300_cov116-Skeletonema_dohrnii-CCMP3373.AAC.1